MLTRPTVGSLFAGIGGFDLGFERAGCRVVWQVESDPFALAVLARHFPEAQRFDDVRTVHGALAHADSGRREGVGLTEHGDQRGAPRHQPDGCGPPGRRHRSSQSCGACLPAVDVICGGFPCQPHSLAGRRGASADDRDLWPHFARLIRECRPRWVVAENVPGLLSSDAGRFFGTVLGDLAACGYDAEWDCLPASAFGAPHQRDRVWLVAYLSGLRRDTESRQALALDGGADVADHDLKRRRVEQRQCGCHGTWARHQSRRGCEVRDVADPASERCQVRPRLFGGEPWTLPAVTSCADWAFEPHVGRVAHGVPARVDRLRGLGNACVPQITEWIARRILEAEGLIP